MKIGYWTAFRRTYRRNPLPGISWRRYKRKVQWHVGRKGPAGYGWAIGEWAPFVVTE